VIDTGVGDRKIVEGRSQLGGEQKFDADVIGVAVGVEVDVEGIEHIVVEIEEVGA
jgi:hypothetical protein